MVPSMLKIVLVALATVLTTTNVSAQQMQIEQAFTANAKIAFNDFSTSKSYSLVGVDSNWSYIRFNSPTVPVWVSSNYIEVEDGIATVRVDRLNARIRPTLEGSIVTKLIRGYSSPVSASENGFSRVVAPQSTVVAVKKQKLIPKMASVNNALPDDIERAAPTVVEDEPISVAKTNVAEPESLASSNTSTLSTNFPTNLDSRPKAKSDNESLKAPPSAESTRHIVAPGDSISLTVFGEGDLSTQDLRVSENGEVAFPLLGALDVSGLNTAQIATLVQNRLAKGYVRDPKVSVSMYSYRPIFIRGEVARTGAFPYAQGLTVGKALALAGGVTAGALENGVSIERDGRNRS